MQRYAIKNEFHHYMTGDTWKDKSTIILNAHGTEVFRTIWVLSWVLSLYDITYVYRLIKTKTVIIILHVHCERASIECFEWQNIYTNFTLTETLTKRHMSWKSFIVCHRIQLLAFKCKKNINRYLFVSCSSLFSILKGFKSYF